MFNHLIVNIVSFLPFLPTIISYWWSVTLSFIIIDFRTRTVSHHTYSFKKHLFLHTSVICALCTHCLKDIPRAWSPARFLAAFLRAKAMDVTRLVLYLLVLSPGNANYHLLLSIWVYCYHDIWSHAKNLTNLFCLWRRISFVHSQTNVQATNAFTIHLQKGFLLLYELGQLNVLRLV